MHCFVHTKLNPWPVESFFFSPSLWFRFCRIDWLRVKVRLFFALHLVGQIRSLTKNDKKSSPEEKKNQFSQVKLYGQHDRHKTKSMRKKVKKKKLFTTTSRAIKTKNLEYKFQLISCWIFLYIFAIDFLLLFFFPFLLFLFPSFKFLLEYSIFIKQCLHSDQFNVQPT